MRLKLKTAPAKELITLEEAKNHLRVDTTADDQLISDLIVTARMLIEKETKRAFITQVWQMFLDSAPHVIEIPKPPLQAIVSIIVIDTDGTESTIDKGDYMVDASQNSPGRVMPKTGYVWPYHRGFASFVVEFKVGYGDEVASVPTALKRAILILTGHLYENRGDEGLTKVRVHPIDEVKNIIAPFKILSF